MATAALLLLLPLIASIGAQVENDEKIIAQQKIEELKQQSIKEAAKISPEMISETGAYISKAAARFTDEIVQITERSKANVFQNAQVYAAQAIAKRPLTVFNCITKAHNNGIKNLNQLLQEYSSKISNTVNEASQDLANLNFDVQLIQSVIEDVYTPPLTTLGTCKDSTCVQKSLAEAQKLSDNVKKHLDKSRDLVAQLRIDVNLEQTDNLSQGSNKILSAENSANRSMKYC